MTKISIPREFVLGTATSAYQIEGAWNLDGKGPSIWDTFSQTPGKVADNVPGDRGVEHYQRWSEDLDLIADMGLDSYRFSLSWPRILPTGTGKVNERGLDFYDRLIDGMLERGIDPFVTLYHWDLPQALEDRGGWANRDVAEWFAEYARTAFDRFGDRVMKWTTLNEPIAQWVGYGLGMFAPGHADARLGRQAMHNSMLAHGRAVQEFRTSGQQGEIGLVVDVWKRHPLTDSEADRTLALRDEQDSFRFFLDEVLKGGLDEAVIERLDRDGTLPDIRDGDGAITGAPIDLVGLNVYARVVVDSNNYSPNWWENDAAPVGGNFLVPGQEYYPAALSDAVHMLINDYGWSGPVYVTENGMSTPDSAVVDGQVDDTVRIRYVSGFLREAMKVLDEGADLRGYYLWSLLDNYEWAAGYRERFGIVHVDSDTMARTPKASAHWYSAVARERQFDV